MSFNPGSGIATDDRHVFLPDETARVKLATETVQVEGKHVTVAVCTLIDEDDGVGQLLRQTLQADPRVSFAAYSIPHRQEALMKLRFHVPADIAPEKVLDDALTSILKTIADTAKLIPP
jgi:DNA-directed RNA polymerase subunit L